jgi:single-stranded-DNA-specific exonuclease
MPIEPVAMPIESAPESNVGTFLDSLFERRAEFLERDRYASIGEAVDFYTKIVGVSFEKRQDIIAGLSVGAALDLIREPANPHDPNAIAIRYGALQLGYIRREIARRIAPIIDAGERYSAEVGSLTGGGPDKHSGVNIRVRRHRPARPRDVRPAERDEVTDLRAAFIGDRSLRSSQEAVLARLDAGRNTLAVMGTGRGKSLCFQLPAARQALEERKKTLVFYPLRALANDQYDALARRLGPLGVRVLRANGSIDGDERAALELALEDGSWDVILATPEFATFHHEKFARPQNRASLLVVDEAHHLYESRHRAAYVGFAALLAELGSPQVLALTATADEAAFGEIRRVLGIDAWVIDPTVRQNLSVVDARNAEDKLGYLERSLDGEAKAIVYGMSRSETHKIAERLLKRFGPIVAFYHAGMPAAVRTEVEDRFRDGELRIVAATSAFGEGIDLPDVRDVVLYHLNFAFTEFNQQAGRAGRDDQPAQIHLLYGEKDRRINDFLLGRSAPSLSTLRELYRGMRALTQFDLLRMNYEDVARTLDLELADANTVAAAVRIWEEAGLLEAGRDDDGRFVRFLEIDRKVDLTQTARYAEAQAERDSFERFCTLALGADAASLEQIINRPIYPDRIPLER